jgi:hypothetical protein
MYSLVLRQVLKIENREYFYSAKIVMVLCYIVGYCLENNILLTLQSEIHAGMIEEIRSYNEKQSGIDKDICNLLANTINSELADAENKIWHAHPVWFLNGNPIVGYSKLKDGIRLMFWSGADFEESKLMIGTGKFKDASIRYNTVEEINLAELKRWLKKSRKIQWDYKNVVKRKGELLKLDT